MQCRNCGAEIAEKALICYRCGTATTEARYKPAASRRGSRSGLIATVLAIAIVVAAGLFLGRSADSPESSRVITAAVIAVAVVVVALRAYARRR
jgi:uncharacterized membrane protein YvbJ